MHLERLHEMLEDLTECTLSAMKENKTHVGSYPISEVTDMIKDLAEAEYHCTITHAMKKSDEEKEEEEKYMLRQMKEQYGEDEGQRYYNDWRYKNGRYAPKGRGTRSYPYMYMPDSEWDRDMDKGYGRMYYTESNRQNTSNASNTSNSSGMNNSSSRSYSEGYSDGNQRGYEDGNRMGYDDGYKRGYDEGRNSNSINRSNSRYDMAKRGYEDSKTMHAGNTAEDNNANVRKIEELMDIISEDVKELLPKMTPSEKTALKSRMQTLTTHVQ